MVEVILDRAGQKGTGGWAVGRARLRGAGAEHRRGGRGALALGTEAPSGSRRRPAAGTGGPGPRGAGDWTVCATRCSRPSSAPTPRASRSWRRAPRHGWALDLGPVATIWRGGCIIRARFLDRIKEAYDRQPELANLLLDPYFAELIGKAQAGLREVGRRPRPARHRRAGARLGAGLLRRLPLGPPAGQPDPGAARLLRRPHLRADRPVGQLPQRLGQPLGLRHGDRADGGERLRQDLGRGAAGASARRRVRRGRRLPSARQRRQDAPGCPARRCRSPAVARDARRRDRPLARRWPAAPWCSPARRSSGATARSCAAGGRGALRLSQGQPSR